MNALDSLKVGLDMADFVCQSYLKDLSDADLMTRPHSACNHINWQIGHLVLSENEMMSAIAPQSMPSLPAGFAEKYARETQGIDDASKFCTKAELLAAFAAQRAATIQVMQSLTDADLDKPTGIDYAPTVVSLLSIQGAHWLMHCGQWVVVRRMLGKPVVI